MQRTISMLLAIVAAASLVGCSTLPMPDRNAAPEVVNETTTLSLGNWDLVAPIDPGLSVPASNDIDWQQ
jgi:PBP1b-binding outer membrane lipoprotein LpoB